ncbi:zinc finger, CCHC-type containing protein [Tanacetum coccineum]
MYAMTSTRPDIAYAVGRLSRFTSNPSRQHWQAITRVFKYLKVSMNYGLSYMGYPSVLEGYSDASWINHVEHSSSTSGWVFLLGGGAISWASKKQTCITGSTIESEFVALAAAGKEAKWLRNLIHEIPIWPKPIAPISIRCDNAPTMAKAYSQIYNGKSRHLGVRHEKDAFLVDYVEGGLCVDNTDAEIIGRCNNRSNKDKGKDSLESKYMAKDSSSKKFLVSNFNNYKMVDSRLVMEQYNELFRIPGQYTQHGFKMDESISVSKESLRAQDSDKGKGKEVAGPSVNMTKEGKNKNNKQNKGNKRDFKEHGIGSGSNKKPKLECWKCGKTRHFKRDCRSGDKKNANAGGSGKGSKDHSQDLGFGYYNNGMFMLNLNKVLDDSDSVYMSSSTVVNSSLWHARLGHVHYKRMLEMSKDELIPAIDENPDKCTTCMLTKITRKPFKSITRKSVILELIHSDLCDFHATPSLGNKKAVVRLPDPKRKTLGEKGIDCIFIGYAEHSKTYRFYVIEPNDSVSVNSIIESRDAIFDENCFSLIPRPKDNIPNSDESQRDDHSDDVPSKIPEPHKGKRVRKAKSYGYDFQLYLVEGSKDQVGS